MLAYMEQLRKRSDVINTTTISTKKKFTSLETQIQQLMASLPENMRKRDWSMSDLIVRLNGRFRDRPHAQQVGTALRQLGWVQFRDYSSTGRGGRFWQHP